MGRKPSIDRRRWINPMVLGLGLAVLLGGSMQSDLIPEDGGDLVDAAGSKVEAARLSEGATGVLLTGMPRTWAEGADGLTPLVEPTPLSLELLSSQPYDRRMAELAGYRVPGAPAVPNNPLEQVAAAYHKGVPQQPQRPRILQYRVGPSDTLWGVAQRFGTDVPTLVRLNQIANPRRLREGQWLRILTVPGLVYRVGRGENLTQISRTYRVSIQQIMDANALADPNHVQAGTELILPGATPPPPPSPPRRSSGAAAAARSADSTHGRAQVQKKVEAKETTSSERRSDLVARGGLPRFIWPADGPVSSEYGPRWGRVHEGVDIAVNLGSPVRAAAGGRVT
ncbi:MAG: LysM peptidoglycan-binding domain-containing M23 family metallopeptidase, partial [Limnochordaceae bacterium]|nr:LysM peptidoglycan-binding domain-containing M23 family metallopeptidase [Limnochordaceae bacterium]